MRTHDRDLARTSVVPAAAVTFLATAAGALASGWSGVTGALLAGSMATAFFGSGLFVSARTASWEPRRGMTVAVLAHGGKVLAGGVVLVLLGGASFYDSDVLAVTLIAVTSAWLGGQLWGMHHLKIFVVEPTASAGPPMSAGAPDPRSESGPKG